MQYIVDNFIVDANAIRTVNVRIDLVPVQAVPLYRDKMTLAGGAKVYFVRLPYKTAPVLAQDVLRMWRQKYHCCQSAFCTFTVQNDMRYVLLSPGYKTYVYRTKCILPPQ